MSASHYRMWRGFSVAALLALACSNPSRDNVFDTINTPELEMEDPVLTEDGIIIAWRFRSEGSLSFRVSRTVDGQTAAVEQVTANGGTDWQNASVTDRMLFGGEVAYRVTSIVGGTESVSVSKGIRIDAPALRVSDLKAEEVYIELSWDAPPVGTTRYHLVRYGPAESMSVLLDTDDTSIRIFRDTPASGLTASVHYTYVLETTIRGAALLSNRTSAALLRAFADYPIEVGSRTILFTVENEINSSGVITVHPDRVSTKRFRGLSSTVDNGLPVDIHDYSVPSVSAAGALGPHAGRLTQFYVGWIDSRGDSARLSSYARTVEHIDEQTFHQQTVSWPSSGGSRTGVCHFGAVKLLFFEGTVLRELNGLYEVMGQLAIEEPIDILNTAGSIWLAYPDRLVRSNEVTSLDQVRTWESVPLPEGMTIQAIEGFRQKIIVLDAESATLTLMDRDGQVLLSWPAPGTGLKAGDLAVHPELAVSLGAGGRYYEFEPEFVE